MKQSIIGTAIFILMLLTSCRQQQQEPAPEVSDTPHAKVQPQETDSTESPSVLRLKPDYEAEVKQWEAFYNLEIEMQKFQQAGRQEGGLIIEDLLNLEKQLSASDFPEKYNIPQVKSRIQLLKTYLLQTKSMLNGQKPDTALTLFNAQKTKIITAFNAIKKQLSETLPDDTEQLLKELEEQLKDTVK